MFLGLDANGVPPEINQIASINSVVRTPFLFPVAPHKFEMKSNTGVPKVILLADLIFHFAGDRGQVTPRVNVTTLR